MPIQLSEVVNDPDFAEFLPRAIQRSSGGSYQKGRWVNAIIYVDYFGIIQPTTAEELDQVPEGDRITGAMTFHTSQPLYETHTLGPNDATTGISDMISWNGQLYKLSKVFKWQDFGYVKAIGVRISGE